MLIVIPVVVGSSPIGHPKEINDLAQSFRLGFFVADPFIAASTRRVPRFAKQKKSSMGMLALTLSPTCTPTSPRFQILIMLGM